MNTGSDFDYTPYQRSTKPGVNAKRRLKGMRKKQMDLEIEQSDIQSPEFEYPRIENEEIIKPIQNTLENIHLTLNDAGNKKRSGQYFDYINEFMSRPRVGGHILVDGELYEIRKLPMHTGGQVMVRKKDYSSQDTQEEIPMPYDFVKAHMIPDAQATEIITSQMLSFTGGGDDNGTYFKDQEWKKVPNMPTLIRETFKIFTSKDPFKINNIE